MECLSFQECRAILFDFGGTLDSDGEHWLDRFYDLYQEAEIDVPPDRIKQAFYRADDRCTGDPQLLSWGLRPLMKYHVHLQFQTLDLRDGRKEDELVEKFCARSEWFLRRNAALLHRIKHRFRLGVVSNFYGNVRVLCEEAGLARSLKVILDSAQAGMSKPDPALFLTALADVEFPPEKVIFVGDSYERDIIPAGQVGMKTIWLQGPHPRLPVHAPPVDASITTLTALEALVA